ncbi:MAG: imidazole glycerol phosphate synthase subunit HisH [Anaerolineae bacterium]|nr:imidazole glycerol phosphate synthase subunit HisH [Gemmatimonadaceae bacterium]
MKVALLDYGVGNLHSLVKALELGGADVCIEADAERALRADALVLPGVGAFGAAANRVGPAADSIRAALEGGLPCLGICLGMQLLFESSEEGEGRGIGMFNGTVVRLSGRRVPHMGWNQVESSRDPLFVGSENLIAYYAHSFVAPPAANADAIAWTEYEGTRFPAAVLRNRTWGVQFHPEKSDVAGVRLVQNFLREAGQ